jgi:flagellar protein FlgJ
MNEEILGLLGVSPEQMQQYQQQQNLAGLQALGNALMQAGAPRQGGKVSTLVGLGQAAPAFAQGRAQEMDTILKSLLQRRQVEQMAAEQQAKQAQAAARTRLVGGLQPQQQDIATAFPESAQGMIAPAPQVFKPGEILRSPTGEILFQAPEASTPEFRDYQKAVQQGYGGSFLDYQTAIKQAGRTQVTATAQAGGEISPFAREAQVGQAKTFNEIQKSGMAAQNNLRTINQLDKYLSKVETGGLAALKQFAGNFGIATEGLSDIQAVTALINRLVPAQRTPGSGPMSDADLALFKQSLPRIINQPGGNQRIIGALKEINTYLIEEGKIASDVVNQKITPEEGARRMSELGNPLENIIDQAPLPAGVKVRRVQ